MNVSIIKNELDEKMKSKFYHFLQVNFAYNSNKIEGSHLTEEETEAIFETNSFIPKADEVVKPDDLIDTIKNEQDIFENVCNELLNFEI